MNSFLKKIFMSPETAEELDFMPAGVAAYRRGTPRKIPIMMLTLISFCIIALLWAGFAEIDKVAHGEGKIIPSSSVQKISNLEGGIIKQILVREGQIVQKDEILMTIDPTIAQARLKEGQDNYYRYLAEVARLTALTMNQPLNIPSEVIEKAPHLGQETMARYNARKERLENEIQIAHQELNQKKEDHRELQTRAESLSRAAQISEQQINLQRPLVAKGLASKMELLRAEQELNDVRGKLDSTLISINKATAAISQAQEKLEQVPVIFKNEDYAELKEAQNRLNQAQGAFTSQENIRSRTEIRSPVKGVVKEIHLTTTGGVVKPGEDIMEIVPLDDNLIVEVNVKPSDIAFIHPGDPAMLKVTAYDYSVYGGLHAELIDISPDTVVDEKDPRRQSYYKVKLRTKSLKFTKSQQEKSLIPGMIVMADIMTGKETVLGYLLKPIKKALNESLTER